MTTPNPYESPSVSDLPAAPDTRLRLSNFNHAGGTYAVVLVMGPLLLAGAIWFAATNRVVDRNGEPNPAAAITMIGIMAILEFAGLVYAVRVPVVWVEVGPTLRYATLLKQHELAWNKVQRIWIDRNDKRLGTIGPSIVARFYLIIQINDYKDLQVLIPVHRVPQVTQIMRHHPRFRDSPFDDEVPEDTSGDRDDG